MPMYCLNFFSLLTVRVWLYIIYASLNNCVTMMPQRYYCLFSQCVPAPPTSLELKEMGGAAIVPQRGGRSYRSPLQRIGRGWRSPAAWPYGRAANYFLWLRWYRVCVGLAITGMSLLVSRAIRTRGSGRGKWAG